MSVKTIVKSNNNIVCLNPYGILATDGIITKRQMDTFGANTSLGISNIKMDTNKQLIDMGSSIAMTTGKYFVFSLDEISTLEDIIFM